MSNGQELEQSKDQSVLDDQGEAGNYSYFNESLAGRFDFQVKKSATGPIHIWNEHFVPAANCWVMNLDGGDWWTACGDVNKTSLTDREEENWMLVEEMNGTIYKETE